MLLVVTLGLGPHPANTPLMHNVDTQMRENNFLWMLTCLIWAKSLGVASILSCHNAITPRPGPASPGHSPSAAAPGNICSGVSSNSQLYCKEKIKMQWRSQDKGILGQSILNLIWAFTSHKEQIKYPKCKKRFDLITVNWKCTLRSKWRIIIL